MIPDNTVLLERWVKARDAEAFAELVRRHAGMIYGTCKRILRDHHLAEDVAQDCLLEFARKAGSVRSSVTGFLHSLATMRARDRLRNDRVRDHHEVAAETERRSSTAEIGDPAWEDLAPCIDEALADLPEEERLPLVLHFLEGRSQGQVAEELGCDQATVSRRITRGIAALRTRLARVGITTSVVLLSGTLAANAAETAPPSLIAAAGKMAIAGIAPSAAAGGATAVIPLKMVATVLAAAVVVMAGVGIGYALIRQEMSQAASPPVRWTNGLPSDPDFFPIGVWLQDPAHAARYRQAGINLYVGLWKGPTEADLQALSAAGMRTICTQNDVGLQHRTERTIAGWWHCTDQDLVAGYDRLVAQDPSRPVLLLDGVGAAWDPDEHGQRRHHGEDEYRRGADILGSQVYPLNGDDPAVRGDLRQIASGVDRLRSLSGGATPVWSWIECTDIWGNAQPKPTPEQVRSEIWMALIHGATGLVYFCHTMQPVSDETALLRDPVMLPAITAINREIASLAPALNSPSVSGIVTVRSSDEAVPIDLLVKRHGGKTYIFAAAMRDAETTAIFAVPMGSTVQVLGEDRSLPISDGVFNDRFLPYSVHLYEIHDPL